MVISGFAFYGYIILTRCISGGFVYMVFIGFILYNTTRCTSEFIFFGSMDLFSSGQWIHLLMVWLQLQWLSMDSSSNGCKWIHILMVVNGFHLQCFIFNGSSSMALPYMIIDCEYMMLARYTSGSRQLHRVF